MNKNNTLSRMIRCALMAALMCALCPLSVPIGPVPVSLSVLIILITVYLLGTRDALISYAVYLLLGAVGMPVFSGFAGGLAKLAGPTGGYLIGFLPMILVCGPFIEKSKENYVISVLGMILGVAVAYAFGTVWFVYLTGNTVAKALTLCVYPFIPFDAAKIVIAAIFGKLIHSALIRAGLLPER